MKKPSIHETWWLPRSELQRLIDTLHRRGYRVVGPTVRNAAIVYETLADVDQLPTGWTDTQSPATYQIQTTSSQRQFGFNSSPDSWKKFLYPARQQLSGAKLTRDGWQFTDKIEAPEKLALFGVRGCDLAAIEIQDRVFLNDDFADPIYLQRRESALIIAVQCSTAAATCFCTSMNTGPECESGFDIALTETDEGFCVEAQSEVGKNIIAELDLEFADVDQKQSAACELENAKQAITKQLDTRNLHDDLLDNLEHPHWDEVATRCLSCTNCTMVCPTCFCSTVDEVSDLDQSDVTRVRQWDSCFNLSFSYTAGGTVRNDVRSRYRQWLTHKLATWQDQFDTIGCTGCGRCITWCPVGIDLTDEVVSIRQPPKPNADVTNEA
ncbi:anaerobic sulfite reductase subunit A [Rhodopirellula maiorica SM1]|uniref:Anaerobic sulfite reductase subunit A n=1 Tax=Rhodopirellula maiorica SM1 TaxID=1265738 RepID=M5RAI0_9BACT|nr:4Fe-4S dicluster domain-containing protein [Rhodopirellula maiorica]EMI16508.1 anaerobic sulfite reductase subunit A [Rhodopirellula maiorica SM1]